MKYELFLKEIKSIISLYHKHSILSGENFNIFSIMGMESDEVRTHSSLICELLNPSGTHGLNEIPLKLFVNMFIKGEFTIDYTTAYCQKEFYFIDKSSSKTKGGRLDLLVRDREGCEIVIENKIYAGEQTDQILRYRTAFPNAKLLYLTLEGCLSESYQNDDYETISYKENILHWIEACAKEAYAKPMVREVLNQYGYLIRKLTNQTKNIEMQEEIGKVIIDNYPESLAIYESFTKVRDKHVKDIFSKVRDQGIKTNEFQWEIEESDLWPQSSSCALVFSDSGVSINLFYLRYEYVSNILFVGIAPRGIRKKGKLSIQRKVIPLTESSDLVVEYLNKKQDLIDDLVMQVQVYIQDNMKEYNRV